MNGIHDMGGMHGMGAIEYEPDEPVFHAPWEGRVIALTRALNAWGKWNIDAGRYALEVLPPSAYLRMSYYERWARRMFDFVVRFHLVTREELESGRAAPGSHRQSPALTAGMKERFVTRDIPSAVDPGIPPQYRVGEHVRTRNIHPQGHTRLPRYARAKTGIITRDHGVYDFPDTNAHFGGAHRQHVYSVRFAARELWGPAASPNDSVNLDLWDDYLERI